MSAGFYVGLHVEPSDDARFKNNHPAIGGWFDRGTGKWQMEIDFTAGAPDSVRVTEGSLNPDGSPRMTRYTKELMRGSVLGLRRFESTGPLSAFLGIGGGAVRYSQTFDAIGSPPPAPWHLPRDEAGLALIIAGTAGIDFSMGQHLVARLSSGIDFYFPYPYFGLERLLVGIGYRFGGPE